MSGWEAKDSCLSIHPEWLAELRSAAEAATPGPWKLLDGWGPASDGLVHVGRIADDTYDTVVDSEHGSSDIRGRKEDFEHIAVVNPSLTLWLTTLLADMAEYIGGDISAQKLMERFEKGPS